MAFLCLKVKHNKVFQSVWEIYVFIFSMYFYNVVLKKVFQYTFALLILDIINDIFEV